MGALCNRGESRAAQNPVCVSTPYGLGFVAGKPNGNMQPVRLAFGVGYMHSKWLSEPTRVKTPYGEGNLVSTKGTMRTVQLPFGKAFINKDAVKPIGPNDK
ncbi:hypothetical protein AAMO2058_001380100 [Amorphochlora amoebiformis]|mmetsp:Transcript_3632/g.5594  ORF Transcript_3632/g.5594 Transcript_3632/m.5594 type:complete len:101 (-) Transcript_3632:197-499(-)